MTPSRALSRSQFVVPLRSPPRVTDAAPLRSLALAAAAPLRSLALAAAALLLCSACRSLPFPEPKLDGEYGGALARATRKAKIYDGLETRAFVRLVYLSPELVAAQAAFLSRERAEPPAEARQRAAKMAKDYALPTFFAVVHTPDRSWNDWESKDSVWRIALDTGSGERLPERVERFEKPFNPEQQSIYPYLDEYSVGYLLHFPALAPPPIAAPTGAPAPGVPAPGVPPPGIPTPGVSAPPVQERSALRNPRMVVAGVLGKMDFHWAEGDSGE